MFYFFFLPQPKHNYLAQVTSNIWGTKFKIVGLASFLPVNLGAGRYLCQYMHITLVIIRDFIMTFTPLCISVIYKTSLLHLQPRQMTIFLPEVRKISHDFMSLPVFNPNVFSEDEDDLPGVKTEDLFCMFSSRVMCVMLRKTVYKES